MPNTRSSNYYEYNRPPRSRRYSYPEMYSQKPAALPLHNNHMIESETFYYEPFGGDNSGIGNSDSDGMPIYNKQIDPMNSNISEMYNTCYHGRIPPQKTNMPNQCEMGPTLPIMNYSQGGQYTRPTTIPVNINNSCYKAQPITDKSVYVNYHNPVYDCGVNQSQYQMQHQRLLEAAFVPSVKTPARIYALKKKKSSGLPTVATPRYVRPGRHNSVLSMPMPTKVEAPRRPVYTQTSPQNIVQFQKPVNTENLIQIKRPKTGTRRAMVPITCAPRNYDESQDSSEPHDNYHLELRNIPNIKKIVSKTPHGTEIEVAKYQKMFVQNNMQSKKLEEKSKKSVAKIKKCKSSSHSSSKSSPQPEKQTSDIAKDKKDVIDTDTLLNSLINDIEGAFVNESLDGKAQIKQMMAKMKAAADNEITKINISPISSRNEKKGNDYLKELKIDKNSSTSYNDYVTKKALQQAYQPNLSGYQKRTTSGLGFDPKSSNLQIDDLHKTASLAELELHRSKTIVVNLIDREISRTTSNQAIAMEPLASTLNIDAGDAIDYVQKSNNMLKEMQITEAVTDTLVGTKYPKPSQIDTGRENKYLLWLKKARKNHLKNIHRELEQLEELDETIDPSN